MVDYITDVTRGLVLTQPNVVERVHVGMMNGRPIFWACVDTSRGFDKVQITFVETGSPPPSVPITTVGTMWRGAYIWHTFEERLYG